MSHVSRSTLAAAFLICERRDGCGSAAPARRLRHLTETLVWLRPRAGAARALDSSQLERGDRLRSRAVSRAFARGHGRLQREQGQAELPAPTGASRHPHRRSTAAREAAPEASRSRKFKKIKSRSLSPFPRPSAAFGRSRLGCRHEGAASAGPPGYTAALLLIPR